MSSSIKFDKFPPVPKPRGITPRRLAAQRRILEKKKQALPLLQNWVEGTELSPEEKILRNDQMSVNGWKSMRMFQAQEWRKIRKALFLMDKKTRCFLREDWNNSPYPKDPYYFAEFLRKKHGIFL